MEGVCVFLKLQNILGWIPDYYTNATVPADMPKYLRDIIIVHEKQGEHHRVWVDCVGENPADIENIGPIRYHPHRGFHGKYFPFLDVKDYVSPLVAVYFEQPKRGVVITVVCKAFARNIKRDPDQQLGSVRFVLLKD